MSSNYWLAIASNNERSGSDVLGGWWCLPFSARNGDIVLFYRPRTADASRNGIFAEAEVTVAPSAASKNNYYCSGYGHGKNFYGYSEHRMLHHFDKRLTAKSMKLDPILKEEIFIRRNFQGTTFPLSQDAYKRIKTIISSL